MTKAPECIWGIFDQFGHGSTMLRDLSQNNNILTAGGNEPTKFVRADLYEAQAAEIERLRGALQWCSGSADFNEGGIAREGWIKLCAPLLTVSATVKESLTTEDEKQSHEWKCPIDYPGCRKHCGSQYGCKS